MSRQLLATPQLSVDVWFLGELRFHGGFGCLLIEPTVLCVPVVSLFAASVSGAYMYIPVIESTRCALCYIICVRTVSYHMCSVLDFRTSCSRCLSETNVPEISLQSKNQSSNNKAVVVPCCELFGSWVWLCFLIWYVLVHFVFVPLWRVCRAFAIVIMWFVCALSLYYWCTIGGPTRFIFEILLLKVRSIPWVVVAIVFASLAKVFLHRTRERDCCFRSIVVSWTITHSYIFSSTQKVCGKY